MCYFVEINLPRQALSEQFGIPMPEDPRYMQANFLSAFTQPLLPVISADHKNRIQLFHWGLIPSWVKDTETAKKIRNATYNARSETVWEKPAFRSAIKRRRCLVLAHGFYEYQTRGKTKIPYYIRKKDDQPFAFAGLSENWVNRETGEILDTFSILTRQANPFMEKIHNSKKRMPVILSEDTRAYWIEDEMSRKDMEDLIEQPAPELEAYTIDKKLITGRDVDPTHPDITKPYPYEEQQGMF
jgi:putative SOS response-associated peptidase YedK